MWINVIVRCGHRGICLRSQIPLRLRLKSRSPLTRVESREGSKVESIDRVDRQLSWIDRVARLDRFRGLAAMRRWFRKGLSLGWSANSRTCRSHWWHLEEHLGDLLTIAPVGVTGGIWKNTCYDAVEKIPLYRWMYLHSQLRDCMSLKCINCSTVYLHMSVGLDTMTLPVCSIPAHVCGFGHLDPPGVCGNKRHPS